MKSYPPILGSLNIDPSKACLDIIDERVWKDSTRRNCGNADDILMYTIPIDDLLHAKLITDRSVDLVGLGTVNQTIVCGVYTDGECSITFYNTAFFNTTHDTGKSIAMTLLDRNMLASHVLDILDKRKSRAERDVLIFDVLFCGFHDIITLSTKTSLSSVFREKNFSQSFLGGLTVIMHLSYENVTLDPSVWACVAL